jgi:hypothetical protein
MFRKALVAFVLVGLTLPLAVGDKTRQQHTADLFTLIDQADEMVVYSEGFKREFVIYRSSSRKDFEELKLAITLKRAGGPFVCACVDGPEIALFKNKKEIAAVWNHEGTAIGSSVWKGDWENRDPDRWLLWFDRRGKGSAREFFSHTQSENRKATIDERRWLDAMPAGLKPLWSIALRQCHPPNRVPRLKTSQCCARQAVPRLS